MNSRSKSIPTAAEPYVSSAYVAQRRSPQSSVQLEWFFALFFISGFCSLLYEIVWLRLAMANFGVTSGLLSIVLSTFMAGMGLGSWASGRLIHRYGSKLGPNALRFYALAELLLGMSALSVPYQLLLGRTLIARFSLASSITYYFATGIWMALTLVPWCVCIGATIPFAMLAIRNLIPEESKRSFSFLYLSNVIGAVLGATLPPLFVELYGFHGTLKIGACLNFLLAASAMTLAWRAAGLDQSEETSETAALPQHYSAPMMLLVLLFMTGCTSMGAEVVWVRQFTPYLGTVVYAFASILGTYLISMFVGSQIYRRWSRRHAHVGQWIWVLLGFCGVLAAVTASPQFHLSRPLRLMLGIAPFSGIMGFVTPMLVDRWSGGDPEKAGTAYAVNVVGCIAGPLLSGFLLLPWLSERWVLFAFSLPWLAVAVVPGWSAWLEESRTEAGWTRAVSYATAALTLMAVFISKGYEGKFARREVLRDNTATIIATGDGMRKLLLVNGYGITALTPITKMMAHLPLTSLNHPPQSALAVCFGMGTTYRSLLSWNIPTTAVELVPSVPKVFWYFHPDAQELLSSPFSHVVIDDGREYLERTQELYDVITIDPPPPVEAAGSSLLYSREFYSIIKRRLRPGGILQQWLPGGDEVIQASVAGALVESFSYVRVFRSVEDWGWHFLASNQPIPDRSPEQLAAQMPAKAAGDLIEWGPEPTPQGNFALVLSREVPVSRIMALVPEASALEDDRPANEYYLLRRRVVPRLRRWLPDIAVRSGR